MSLTTKGWKDCAIAPAAAASRIAAHTAANPLLIPLAGEKTVQVVVEREGHHHQQQRQANALPELHRALGDRPALDDLDRVVQEVAAVEQRDRQQVEHAEAD